MKLIRTPANPDIGWTRPIMAVVGAIFVPAVIAALYLMVFPTDTTATYAGWDRLTWFIWRVAACLTASPLFVILTLPLSAPAVWLAARFGFAGPVSLVLIALGLGLPAAHIMLNGDVTTEAPQMIPVLIVTITLQALLGWVIFAKMPSKGTKNAKSGVGSA